MTTGWTIFRWVMMVPGALVAVPIATLIARFACNSLDAEVWRDVTAAQDFGGHWIAGPSMVLVSGAAAAGGFVVGGAIVAPSSQRVVAITLAIITSLFAVLLAGATLWMLAWGPADFLRPESSLVGVSIRTAQLFVGLIGGAWAVVEVFNQPNRPMDLSR